SQLFAHHLNQRLVRDRLRHPLREQLAVNGQRMSGRYATLSCNAHRKRVETPEFLLQQPRRAAFFFALEGVAADEFAERIGLVRRRVAHRPHLKKMHAKTPASDLPSCFRPREAPADHKNFRHWSHLRHGSIIEAPRPKTDATQMSAQTSAT